MAHAVSLSQVSCVFVSAGRAVRAVDDVTLDIAAGEFFTLLGPSGSGKTTCLRMIGGFTRPTAGSISIYGNAVSALPPFARPVTTVFQDYALFPHMTVLENVGYSLMVRGVPKVEREQRASEMLEVVRLPDMSKRKPAQLSGGQRQRVALARALVSEPKVLLLDEPLGALDLKLREQMQVELKELQRRLGITFVLVTHDQHEAFSISDRIGVFNQGRLEQVDSPSALYERPTSRFVAEFLGAANVLEHEAALALTGYPTAMIRPERITIGPSSSARISGQVEAIQYFGSFWRIKVRCPLAVVLMVDLPVSSVQPAIGDTVHLHWDASAVHQLRPSVSV
ncbi:MAG: ABC transporter ATP-binding protein [Burkholderiaceae bacterium]|jgi:putative spermidine/putrescine transport system ATP-binding protein